MTRKSSCRASNWQIENLAFAFPGRLLDFGLEGGESNEIIEF